MSLTAVRASLPDDAVATNLIPVAIAPLGAADRAMTGRRPATVLATARRLCAGAVGGIRHAFTPLEPLVATGPVVARSGSRHAIAHRAPSG